MSRVAAVLLLALFSGRAPAHHSFAAFEMDKTLEVRGTVSKYEWTNPHVWIWITPESGGNEFGVEAHAVSSMVRTGWSRDSLKVGDKVVILVHPRKDGGLAGSIISAALANGTPVPAQSPAFNPPPQ
ncbi:MAG TPA: DUF6152 family protein [Steroidobacteraceae bacterium]|nr:DUF6152 family protein [Steroidobacteraceae bacterium]